MVFNSFHFLIFFLPAVLSGFYYFSRKNRQWSILWLTAASLFFYGSWDYRFIPILLTSILVNYAACKQIILTPPENRRQWLTAAVIFNLLLLGFFKYANFFIATLNDAVAGGMTPLNIILPVGISFFTFTQVSLLVDACHGKIKELNFIHYLLFVSYFPYIVAGPILHHKEMLPQFAGLNHYPVRGNNFSIGVSLFVFGLGKKLLIADNLALALGPVFAAEHPQFFQAWIGALAYTLQLYFDFSGYSDMAVGVSRLMGFRIPINFNSPYKAKSVSDFWERWHISLSQFLRHYLYIPLGGNRQGQFRRYRNLLLTMLMGGLWHGANWTFVVWGGLHGLYLCVQHGWRQVMKNKPRQPTRFKNFLGRSVTFVAVVIAWCFFRSPSVVSAMHVMAGLIGQNGISPVTEIDAFAYIMLAAGTLVVFFMPNTNELFLFPEAGKEEKPALPSLLSVKWSPSVSWGIVIGFIFALCILSIERVNDFIYAQF